MRFLARIFVPSLSLSFSFLYFSFGFGYWLSRVWLEGWVSVLFESVMGAVATEVLPAGV